MELELARCVLMGRHQIALGARPASSGNDANCTDVRPCSGSAGTTMALLGDYMPLIDSIGDGQFASQRRQALRTAFVAALRDLGLCDRDDPLVQMVAKTVIEIASGGESNPEQIRRLALD